MTRPLEKIRQILSERAEIEELSTSTLSGYQQAARKNRQDNRNKIFDTDAEYKAKAATRAKRDVGLLRAQKKIVKKEQPSHDELRSQLKDLHSKFDPQYHHSDDHSVYTKHAAIASKMADIKRKLGE